MIITVSNALAADFGADLITRLGSAATCRIYTGTKPAGPDIAPTTQILLGTLTLSATPGSFSGRRFTFNSITQCPSAEAGGTATWARFTDGTLAVLDVDIGTNGGGAYMQMANTTITASAPISINDGAYIDF